MEQMTAVNPIQKAKEIVQDMITAQQNLIEVPCMSTAINCAKFSVVHILRSKPKEPYINQWTDEGDLHRIEAETYWGMVAHQLDKL